MRRNRLGHFRGRGAIQRLKREELGEVFNKAFIDRDRAEVVSQTESKLLDVERGEVLRNSRYIRTFTL